MRLSKEERAGAAALAAVVICVLLMPLLPRACSRHDDKPLPVVTIIQAPPAAKTDSLSAGNHKKHRSSTIVVTQSDSLRFRTKASKGSKSRKASPEPVPKPSPLDVSIETKSR